MKRLLILSFLAAFLFISCGQEERQKLSYGIILEKAAWSENSLHEKCVVLDFTQEGGYGALEKEGKACEKVVLGFTVLGQRTGKSKEWEPVGSMTTYESEIKAEGDTRILLYPPKDLPVLPQKGIQYCLRIEIRAEYPGWQSLNPEENSKAPAPDSKEYIIDIKDHK